MKTPKKSASWQDIRRILTAKSPKELLTLMRDLYALRPEVKDVLHARFLPAAQPLAPYKKTIQTALYPGGPWGRYCPGTWTENHQRLQKSHQ